MRLNRHRQTPHPLVSEKVIEFECRFCSNTHAKRVVSTFDHHSNLELPIDLVECSNCGIISIFPLPNEKTHEAAYPTDIVNPLLYSQNQRRKFVETLYRFFHPYSVRWRMKRVQKEIGVGRLLDVGCRNGDFLQVMRQQLWEVAGIERNQTQFEFATQTLGLEVYRSFSDLMPKCEGHFDVITYWHSLGHFSNPLKALDESLRLLRKNGLILIALPNLLSLDFLIYKSHWAALDAPRRLFHFSPQPMRNILRKKGLALVRKKVIPFDIYYNCLLSEKILIDSSACHNQTKIWRYFRAGMIGIIAHILSASGAGSGMLYVVKRDGK
jgi:SAM-dependent methyltransferase